MNDNAEQAELEIEVEGMSCEHCVATVTGNIEFGDSADPEVDEVLDDLGELTLKMGGEVVVVPTERMPTKTGIAAIYRY